MPVDLVTIVYFSHARRAFSDDALLDLLTVSRRNNQRDGITGMLLYHDGNFVQALEGPRSAIERTFERIGKDPGHDGIISTGTIPINARQFPDWSMAFLPATSLPDKDRQLLSTFLDRGPEHAEEFNTMAWSMLKAFRDGLPTAR